MKFRSIFPLMLLAMQSALPGQDAGELMRKGEDALASGMWEIAALHFNECLTSRNTSPGEKSQAAIRLAESWIREGRTKEALDLLGQSFVSQHPEALFWKGQALSGMGRYADAVGAFVLVLNNPAAPHRSEAGFSMANVELALGRPESALATLSSLTNNAEAALATKARLRQVEILLDLGRTREARQTMPEIASISPEDQSFATFLEANLLLKEGRSEDAASSFQTLVDQPQGQSLPHYLAAVIGLADALRASRNPDAATPLLKFIQDHPESPQLTILFDRLLDCLPEKPTATDPILDRLKQWIPDSKVPVAPGAVAIANSGAEAPCVEVEDETKTGDLLAHALFSRAMGLKRVDSPLAAADAKRLLTRLRVEFPVHPLTIRALFETARRALEQGKGDQALDLLASLRETRISPHLAGEAAFLEARTAYARGDKEQAIRLFDDASKLLAANEAKTARLNVEIIRLAESPTLTVQAPRPVDESLTADLELESALTREDPVKRRAAIEEFLTKHAAHPRIPEARLAVAEAALTGKNPDLSFARAQLDTLASDPQSSAELDPLRIAMVQLRIEDLSKETAAAIASARKILEKHEGQPAAAEAALILGRNLIQSNSYNDAYLVLKKLAESDTDPGRAQAAWLLAAQSAALVPTTQSKQEALILFDNAIKAKGSIADLARLEKARLMIDMKRHAEAVSFLRKWFADLKPADPLHLPAGLLLGEATYNQGSATPTSLNDALAVFNQLLTHTESQPALFNLVQYWRGKTLEEMPDEKNPSLKRTKEAFIAYYSVLETTTPPAEWYYFELCGGKALGLLEKAGRWPAAIACAKKIASFKCPNAKGFTEKATRLQTEHMIWED